MIDPRGQVNRTTSSSLYARESPKYQCQELVSSKCVFEIITREAIHRQQVFTGEVIGPNGRVGDTINRELDNDSQLDNSASQSERKIDSSGYGLLNPRSERSIGNETKNALSKSINPAIPSMGFTTQWSNVRKNFTEKVLDAENERVDELKDKVIVELTMH